MMKLWAIARREFLAMVATRAFWITMLLAPVLMFGSLALLPYSTSSLFKVGKTMMNLPQTDKTQGDKGGAERPAKVIRIADGTGNLGKILIEKFGIASQSFKGSSDTYQLELIEQKTLDDETRRDLIDSIRNGSLHGFIEIPESLLDPGVIPEARYVSRDFFVSMFMFIFQSTIDSIVRIERLKKLGVDPQQASIAIAPVRISSEPIRNDESGNGKPVIMPEDDTAIAGFNPRKSLLGFMRPYLVSMFFYLLFFVSCQPMLESSMEEKGIRISETLLAAVPSWKLLVGKLIGNLAGSLLTILIYLACIYAVLKLRGWEEWFPTENIPWLVLFQSFGVLFYSSLFMIVGSSVRDYKEAQSCLLPFWMLLILPTILSIKFTTDPGGTLATWCSMIPLTSPMTNVILVTGKLPPPTWQLIVSLLILASTACFSVWAAGRIYRASMLRTDSANSFLQMIKRINSPS